MMVGGQSTPAGDVDIGLMLRRAPNTVEKLKAKVAKMSARIKHLEHIQGPPGGPDKR